MKQQIYILTILTIFSCQRFDKVNDSFQVDTRAKYLNDEGVRLIKTFNNDSIRKALKYLEEATTIQPEYYLANWNKFVCQNQLGLKESAHETLKILEELRPKNPDLKVTIGVFMELNNDSSAARQKFIQAEQIYSLVLDTLSVSSDKKQLIILNKALNLRLLGKDEEANQIFEEINLKAENDITKQLMVTFQRMTRKDVIEFYIVAANDKSPTR